MAGVTINNDGTFTYPGGDFGYYDLDEPFERDEGPYPLSVSQVVNIANNIYSNNSDAKFCLTSWKKPIDVYTMGYLSVLGQTSNTEMICDQYYDQSIWCGDDQRTHWTLFKNYYGSSRVKAHWMHLLIDGMQGDFYKLFGHANNLGINKLWIYAGDAEGYCDDIILTYPYYELYLSDLGTAAWSNGWLRAIQRKYVYEYRCSYPNPCDCDRNLPDGWYLYKVWPFNEYREYFPGGGTIPVN